MDLATFKALADPAELDLALQALWHDARGDWHRAHTLAQEEGGGDGDWVHAYLHRKEGDKANADYWYRCAGREPVGGQISLEHEWDAIVTALLAKEESRKIM
jgi:hypothetical protein